MASRVSKKPVKEYRDLGKMKWNEIPKEYYTPGLHTTAISSDMWRDEGEEKVVTNDKTGTKITVIYDETYILETLFRTFIQRLGLCHEGGFEHDTYNLVVDKLREYSLQYFERDKEVFLRQQAQELSEKLPYLTSDEWYETLAEKAKSAKASASRGQTSLLSGQKKSIHSKKSATLE